MPTQLLVVVDDRGWGLNGLENVRIDGQRGGLRERRLERNRFDHCGRFRGEGLLDTARGWFHRRRLGCEDVGGRDRFGTPQLLDVLFDDRFGERGSHKLVGRLDDRLDRFDRRLDGRGPVGDRRHRVDILNELLWHPRRCHDGLGRLDDRGRRRRRRGLSAEVREQLSEQRPHLVRDGGPDVGCDPSFDRVRSRTSGKLIAARFLKCFAQQPHLRCEHAALLAGTGQLSVRFNTRVAAHLVSAATFVGLRGAESAARLGFNARRLRFDLRQYRGDPRLELSDTSRQPGEDVVGRQRRGMGGAALPACEPDQVFRARPFVLHRAKRTSRNRLKTGRLGGFPARRRRVGERSVPRGSRTSRGLPRREESTRSRGTRRAPRSRRDRA